jgi:hypothetical protein
MKKLCKTEPQSFLSSVNVEQCSYALKQSTLMQRIVLGILPFDKLCLHNFMNMKSWGGLPFFSQHDGWHGQYCGVFFVRQSKSDTRKRACLELLRVTSEAALASLAHAARKGGHATPLN